MFGRLGENLGSFYLSHRAWLVFWLVLIALELLHLKILFGGASYLAGGDNYTYLLLGRQKMYPYLWDNYYPFGVKSFTLPNLFGFQLYSQLFPFLSGPVLERIIIFGLIFLKFVAFVKLARLLSGKNGSWLLLPPILFLTFNAFASLNPFNYYQLLYSAYLPIFLYYFIKIFESPIFDLPDIVKITLWSVLASPVNANPALSATVFIPPALYLLVNFKKITPSVLKRLFLLAGLWLIVNLWWLWPLLNYFLSVSGEIINKDNWFTATSVGSLWQNFRLIGQWGWYGRHFLHAYYPFSTYYDQIGVMLLTFLIIFLSFYEATRHQAGDWLKRTHLYLLGLSLLGLFLVSGARLPFGFFYQLLFNYFPGFRIFREPFTKFSEIYALSVSLLFYLFLVSVFLKESRRLRLIIWIACLGTVAVVIKPAYLASGVVDYWNGSVRTARVEIPSYWEEFSRFAQENLSGQRILTTPRVAYGNAWNWPKGFSSGDDLAAVFTSPSVNVLRAPLTTGSVEEQAVEGFFKVAEEPAPASKYLALLGVVGVLQENDLDWRYNSFAADPIKMQTGLKKFLRPEISFGLFSQGYLDRIPNGDPNPYVRQELRAKLLGRPALTYYALPVEKALAKIYAPRAVVTSEDFSLEKAPALLALGETQAGDLYLSQKVPLTVNSSTQKSQLVSTTSAEVLAERVSLEVPVSLQFRQINPTRYSVTIRGAPRQYLLAFLERFDRDWKIYGQTQPGLIKSVDEKNHFLANGFANAWLIDVENFGGVESQDFTIEYRAQRYSFLIFPALLVGFGSTYLIFRSLRSRKYKL